MFDFFYKYHYFETAFWLHVILFPIFFMISLFTARKLKKHKLDKSVIFLWVFWEIKLFIYVCAWIFNIINFDFFFSYTSEMKYEYMDVILTLACTMNDLLFNLLYFYFLYELLFVKSLLES
jgi:hypothetical protein